MLKLHLIAKQSSFDLLELSKHSTSRTMACASYADDWGAVFEFCGLTLDSISAGGLCENVRCHTLAIRTHAKMCVAAPLQQEPLLFRRQRGRTHGPGQAVWSITDQSSNILLLVLSDGAVQAAALAQKSECC